MLEYCYADDHGYSMHQDSYVMEDHMYQDSYYHQNSHHAAPGMPMKPPPPPPPPPAAAAAHQYSKQNNMMMYNGGKNNYPTNGNTFYGHNNNMYQNGYSASNGFYMGVSKPQYQHTMNPSQQFSHGGGGGGGGGGYNNSLLMPSSTDYQYDNYNNYNNKVRPRPMRMQQQSATAVMDYEDGNWGSQYSNQVVNCMPYNGGYNYNNSSDDQWITKSLAN
ncbi:hypothetical protein EZV62_017520 [Acer yangbiense]|uniref:Uncharacterized protein n=1 Tax=Acer yangbiense TaxID=1000413 RepID=A0A5C7HGR8_9ROSI|nr:hypothetical protein EZV62_017520 [Acer yangbiense]